MRKKVVHPVVINSISELNQNFGIVQTPHALINIIDLQERDCADNQGPLVLNLFSIWMKKGVNGYLGYGEGQIDFAHGTLVFMSPGQVLYPHNHRHTGGWGLIFHPDLLKGYPLAKTIRQYDFFSYSTDQALGVTQEEELAIGAILNSIQKETNGTIDQFSHDVVISQLEVLLTYANRFYHRQFTKKKEDRKGLLEKVEELLINYLNSEQLELNGLPTVNYLAHALSVSPNHLSDLLKENTGKSASEHIAINVIEKAKELITTTTLSAGEIAFHMGYQHSQSFSKLFKKKVGCSPLEYRQRFIRH
ncbi:AraC-type DNA-binding protein [Chitinophaga sp. CF118]|uniref:helix-turn-helix domain-containing protein n=1 Tax=Chitinophaga sp. CF118 TaxID=1884367 RepID=UPI0008E8C987|nr:helix-turn-helix transcriptional regulator [Chitinophaga sp. CF118]SFE59998.1 AraC-type DNA-binding protein [Chitinophaga sp. CF118]